MAQKYTYHNEKLFKIIDLRGFHYTKSSYEHFKYRFELFFKKNHLNSRSTPFIEASKVDSKQNATYR